MLDTFAFFCIQCSEMSTDPDFEFTIYPFYDCLPSDRHVPVAHPSFRLFFFFFMVLHLLSRHSSHSSDEADFNDPSLLENLQSNHVSNARGSVPSVCGALLDPTKDF